MIEIQDLTKTYEGFKAVDGLSLRVERGEILGLVGPNGAGKTTSLRCLAGIIPPTAGRITICGFDLDEHPVEARQRLAFVPDEPHLFEHLTVWDHITLFSRLYGVADGPPIRCGGRYGAGRGAARTERSHRAAVLFSR